MTAAEDAGRSGPTMDEITTEAALQRALSAVLASAIENGIDVRGSYVFRDWDSQPHVEVEIVGLAGPADGDSGIVADGAGGGRGDYADESPKQPGRRHGR